MPRSLPLLESLREAGMRGGTLLPPPGPGCCTIGRAEWQHRNQVGKPQEGGKASGGWESQPWEVAAEASSPEQGPGLHELPWHGAQPSLAVSQ